MRILTNRFGFRGLALSSLLVAPWSGHAYAQTQPPTPTQTTTPAQTPTQPPTQSTPPADNANTPKAWTFNGFLDWYYQYDFNHPPAGTAVTGRQFDVKNDSFSFAVLEVNVVHTPNRSLPVGLTLTGTLGKNADIAHATEPGGTNTYKYLQQAYATYITSGRTPVTIDFGKYNSWIGYEVIESASNDNYSRSFLYTYAQPLYHAGLRFTAPFNSRVSGGFYAVNGWNDVEDSNSGKTFGASLNFNTGQPFSGSLNWIGGQEGRTTVNGAGSYGGIGFPTAGVRDVNLADLILTWQTTTKLKLALNADYADASKPGVMGGHWNGVAIYGHYQLTRATAAALRWEHFEDPNGLRTGIGTNLNSITATFEYQVKGALIHRLEFRHDDSTAPFFSGSGGLKRGQDTLTFAQVYKF